MKKMLLLLSFLMPTLAGPALAAPNWSHTYDATYSLTNDNGGGLWRTASDGRGHLLIEMRQGSRKDIFIYDRATAMAYVIADDGKQKGATRFSFDENNNDLFPVTTVADARQRNAQEIGQKNIAGHPCHGYRYSPAGNNTVKGTVEAWIGDDTNFLVQSVSKTDNHGSATMTLQYFTPEAPSAENFALPTVTQ